MFAEETERMSHQAEDSRTGERIRMFCLYPPLVVELFYNTYFSSCNDEVTTTYSAA